LARLQGQPKQVLTIPQQSASAGLSGSTAVGLTDLAFFGSSSGSGGGSSGSGGGYVVLASGMGGQVFLWDCRAKSAPSATLSAATGQGQGAAYAVQLSPDQQVVMAGMQSGEVKLWDLR
jgi:WD40 repeat protein